jgi:hypothetical protein
MLFPATFPTQKNCIEPKAGQLIGYLKILQLTVFARFIQIITIFIP